MPDRTTVTACLVRKSASLPSTRFPIRSDLVRIGRGLENDIVLNDEPNVSVHHVEIRRVDGSYRLYDLQSTNGTYVNGTGDRNGDTGARFHPARNLWSGVGFCT